MSVRIFISLIGVFFFMISCGPQQVSHKEEPQLDLSIEIQCYQHPRLPNQEYIKTGLKWVLSYLGAQLNKGQIDSAITWQTHDSIPNQQLSLDFDQLGFSDESKTELGKIITGIKQSPSYQAKHYVDVGRLVSLLLLEPKNYYAVTRPCSSLQDFRNVYTMQDTAILFLLPGESTISMSSRQIFSTTYDSLNLIKNAFLSNEGYYDSTQGMFIVEETEAYDFMPNGQPRFAIYDQTGKLVDGASSKHTTAGKPSKCLWCHESKVQPNYVKPNDPDIARFNRTIQNIRRVNGIYRDSLHSELEFRNRGQHTTGEMLYLTFMDPTAERVAMEWNMELEKVKELLKDLESRTHPEFADLGQVYERNEVDKLSPVEVHEVPKKARDSDR